MIYGAEGELDQGVVDMPYDIDNVQCENGPAAAHVRIGWYRSVYNIPHGFAIGSFVDEMAVAAGKDPVAFILDLLGPRAEASTCMAMGVNYGNYGRLNRRLPDRHRASRGVVAACRGEHRMGSESFRRAPEWALPSIAAS